MTILMHPLKIYFITLFETTICMGLQVIQDGKGKNAGVFIPIEEWTKMKVNYPDIDQLDKEIPDWQKDLLDKRLDAIAMDPLRIKPIEHLFNELDSDN